MVKQDTVKKFVVSPVPSDQKPLFPQEFIALMADKAYETLRAYMEKAQAKPEAVKLLDELVVLSSYRYTSDEELRTWISNQGMAEALGSMTYQVIALGGLGMLHIE